MVAIPHIESYKSDLNISFYDYYEILCNTLTLDISNISNYV